MSTISKEDRTVEETANSLENMKKEVPASVKGKQQWSQIIKELRTALSNGGPRAAKQGPYRVATQGSVEQLHLPKNNPHSTANSSTTNMAEHPSHQTHGSRTLPPMVKAQGRLKRLIRGALGPNPKGQQRHQDVQPGWWQDQHVCRTVNMQTIVSQRNSAKWAPRKRISCSSVNSCSWTQPCHQHFSTTHNKEKTEYFSIRTTVHLPFYLPKKQVTARTRPPREARDTASGCQHY